MTSLSEGLTRVATLEHVGRIETAAAPRRGDGRGEAVVTDADLLRRCRRRDPEAWAELVSRYERLVYTVARRGGLGAEDAADVAHATFVALADALDRLPDDERLASWLMTVARRRTWSSRNQKGPNTPLDVAGEPATDPFDDWETTTALHDALAVLGGTSRELLLALYFERKVPSHAALAPRFGRPAGAIGPLRGSCLEELRMIMGAEA
ncbi:RNA polymerase sigma factor [Pimelobacter simplex]|uniref:RNA polymerase sigma factor n=1 Tax=Nocardioides simplex TaxID=2045 RepID=UPI0019323EBF|nr:sigma-70 family RNA polymerase sigma factor [Pimelobacter simplex]